MRTPQENKTESGCSWMLWPLIILLAVYLYAQAAKFLSPPIISLPTFTDAELATSRAMRACEDDASMGVPDEFSRCFEHTPGALTEQEKDDQIAAWEYQATQSAGPSTSSDFSADVSSGCPNGCTTYVPGCDIKGNISVDSQEKIYHVPGQDYYSQTSIDSAYGERWFCTEQEAIANGWRKAYQ